MIRMYVSRDLETDANQTRCYNPVFEYMYFFTRGPDKDFVWGYYLFGITFIQIGGKVQNPVSQRRADMATLYINTYIIGHQTSWMNE